ncbi:MAG: hypothetical protein JXA96_17390 [Sedimentisphaerales bacterium]|nr:hypothetical protein [Sedimentisphaerales bacterium]
MAISCDSTITVLDIPNKIINIKADISVDEGPTHTVIVENGDMSTGLKKAELANIVWDKFLVKYNQQLAEEGIADEITALETALNTNIEAREL